MWDWKSTCCLSVFSCWSLFLFGLCLSSFPVVSPFVYGNVENPSVFGRFFGGLVPPSTACDRGCLHAVAISICSGKMDQRFGLNPSGLLMGLVSRGWWWDVCAVQEARDQNWYWALVCGMKILCLLPCAFDKSRSYPSAFRGDTRDCCRDGPTGRNPAEFLQRGTELYRNESSSLQVHDKWNQSHPSLSLTSQSAFPLRSSQEYIVGIRIRATTCCLLKGNQRSLST